MEIINVQKRDFTVKAKKLRRLGLVPGNIFGKSLPETIAVQIEEAVARKLIREKREGSKITLKLDGKSYPVQIKEISLNALTNVVLNLSFQALKADEKVNSVAHILVTGDEKIPGILEKMTLEIPYSAFPADMIDTVVLDIEGITAGTIIKVKDIPELMDEKIELQIDTEEFVLRVSERKSGELVEDTETAGETEAEAEVEAE